MMNSKTADYAKLLGGTEQASEYYQRMSQEHKPGDDPAIFAASLKFRRPIFLHDACLRDNYRRYPCEDPKDDPFELKRHAWHLLRTQTGFGKEEVGHFEAILTPVEEDEESVSSLGMLLSGGR